MNDKILSIYLSILGIARKKPDKEYLFELNYAHLTKIPFENLSKLYYLAKKGLKNIPDIDMYLDGIKRHNFGGTCYSNNYYFYSLLKKLGFDLILCGAQIGEPNGHAVSMVNLDGDKYLIDVGYAAPFFEPLPLNLKDDYQTGLGRDKYILKPGKKDKTYYLELWRDGNLCHGYKVTDEPKSLKDFEAAIGNSFKEDSVFMKALLMVKFGSRKSYAIHNLSTMESSAQSYDIIALNKRSVLVDKIQEVFSIRRDIIKISIDQIQDFKNAWS